MSASSRCAMRLHESGGCLREVLLESHLALEVGDRRLDDETQAGQAFLAGEVVGGAHAVGCEDRDPLQGERLAGTHGPTGPLSAINVQPAWAVASSRTGSYSFSLAATSVYPTGTPERSVTRTRRTPHTYWLLAAQ